MLVYLHGFRSSPNSHKAQQLIKAMQQRGLSEEVACPALSPVPAEAIRQIELIIAKAPNTTLLGSSLGGYYATYLAEKYSLKTVLINPAVLAHITLADYVGPQTIYQSNESFDFTQQHVEQLKQLAIVSPTPLHYLLLLEKGDAVLDWRQAHKYYAGAEQIVLEGGDHGFSCFTDYLPKILSFAGYN